MIWKDEGGTVQLQAVKDQGFPPAAAAVWSLFKHCGCLEDMEEGHLELFKSYSAQSCQAGTLPVSRLWLGTQLPPQPVRESVSSSPIL